MMTDPIADMLTRIRNAQAASKREVTMPSSKLKIAVAAVLKEEGYIQDFLLQELDNKPILNIQLKYYQGAPVIELLQMVSKPSRRVYMKAKEIPKVRGGLGITIVSTSHGVMSDRNARLQNHGGEVLCIVA